MSSTAPPAPTATIATIALSQFPIAALLDAVRIAHLNALTELAEHADDLAHGTPGAPATNSPGSDALLAIYPHFGQDFTRLATRAPTPAPPPPRARDLAAHRWGLR
jgi:hypothetical protein